MALQQSQKPISFPRHYPKTDRLFQSRIQKADGARRVGGLVFSRICANKYDYSTESHRSTARGSTVKCSVNVNTREAGLIERRFHKRRGTLGPRGRITFNSLNHWH